MQNKKDRGMIKWRPFASLPEHIEYLEELQKNKNKKEKAKISNDKLTEINNLVEKCIINSTKLVLKLYKNGTFIQKICRPITFDFENRCLIIINTNNKKERISVVEIIDAEQI